VARLARQASIPLIADEVMTGFGRTGSLFASHGEGVQPDFLCVAKGMTGGYLPMAATLVTDTIYQSFLGCHSSGKTFYHGHSYTGNQLGASVSLASLKLLQQGESNGLRRKAITRNLAAGLQSLWAIPQVGDIRQAGTVVGVELVQNWQTRKPWDASLRIGARVCQAMAARGVLTRPIGDVIVLMPPYCATPDQIDTMITVLQQAIVEVMAQ